MAYREILLAVIGEGREKSILFRSGARSQPGFLASSSITAAASNGSMISWWPMSE